MQEILFKPEQKALTLRGYQEEAINKIKQGTRSWTEAKINLGVINGVC